MQDLQDFALWLLDTALWCMFWYFIFAALRKFIELKMAAEEAGELREELVDKLTKIMHGVKQEKHNDVYYWFDEETDQFLAQGKNTEEIRAHLKERWRDHIFLINGTHVMAGPDYELKDAKSADEMGKDFANEILTKLKARIDK